MGIGMNGLLVVDKPAGMTSHDVVAVVRRATGERSVGHLGTLDPMATGVLPLLLGRYTRLAQFFQPDTKRYRGEIRFGFATDTFDAEGTATSERVPLRLTLEELRELATRFRGEMQQTPPVFSAKKIGGVRAYQLARAGADVPVRPARISIHAFELLGLAGGVAEFTMHISSGGYVRSVAHELGQLAGTGAHLASLRRTQVGPFSLEHSVPLEDIRQRAEDGCALRKTMVHPRSLLPDMPAVTADERTAGSLRNGMQVNLPEYSNASMVKVFSGPDDLVAVARRVAGTLMQPAVVLG